VTDIAILSLSLGLQMFAAGIAILLIREAKQHFIWGAVAAALALMCLRRGFTFYDAFIAGDGVPPNRTAELTALFISAAFAVGMFGIRNFLNSLQVEKKNIDRRRESLAEAQNIARVGNWDWDLRTNAVSCSDELYRIFGFQPGATPSTYDTFFQRVHPGDRQMLTRRLDSVRHDQRPFETEFRLLLPGGVVRIVHVQGITVSDNSGVPVRMKGTTQDITERRRAEDLATRFGRIIENATNEILIFDAETLHFVSANRRARENLGFTLEELRRMKPSDIKPNLSFDECETLLGPLRDGTQRQLKFETVHRRKDGTTYDVEARLQLVHSESPPVFFAIIEDMSERKRTATELHKKDEFFRALTEQAPDMIFLMDDDTTIRFASPSVQRVMGYPPEALIGQQWSNFVHPDDLTALRALQRHTILDPEALQSAEFRFRHFDGSWCVIDSVARNLLEDPVVRAIVVNSREVTDRVVMEEQLRHAHKMEAVGQLTGGIAHDFNNLLAVIIGNLDVLEEQANGDADALKFVHRAAKAAQRGAMLTERLLAFSRKQSLRPRAVNMNEVVGFLSDLLPRMLGETVKIEISPAAGLWLCEVDPVQFENAILNLAINARDAMPQGGTLTIEMANAELDDEYAAAQADVIPGQYVVFSMSDSGVGMTPSVLAHAFEPFFTTKEVGKGTGLGLSMVYGFVKQSGGHVTIYSEPGEGTTVRLYMPRAHRDMASERSRDAAISDFRARGETVLVVEDDVDVRSLAVTLLADLGYSVLEAGHAKPALDLLADNPRVNLILTDMVMPGGMNGHDLATAARHLCPGIHVVYMTGYSETAASRSGRLRHDEVMLQKPFRRNELARKIREVLDADHGDDARTAHL